MLIAVTVSYFVWSASYTQPRFQFSDMGGGVIQPAGKDPFSLSVSLNPESPRDGDRVGIEALVKSNVSPHSRVVASFFVDGQKVKEVSGVIAPAPPPLWCTSGQPHEVRIR